MFWFSLAFLFPVNALKCTSFVMRGSGIGHYKFSEGTPFTEYLGIPEKVEIGRCVVMSTAAPGREPREAHNTKTLHPTSTTNEEFHCETSAIWIRAWRLFSTRPQIDAKQAHDNMAHLISSSWTSRKTLQTQSRELVKFPYSKSWQEMFYLFILTILILFIFKETFLSLCARKEPRYIKLMISFP